MITTPLPSGGPVLVSMLNILEGFNFTEKDQGKSLTYHYILEVGNQCSTLTFQLTSLMASHTLVVPSQIFLSPAKDRC